GFGGAWPHAGKSTSAIAKTAVAKRNISSLPNPKSRARVERNLFRSVVRGAEERNEFRFTAEMRIWLRGYHDGAVCHTRQPLEFEPLTTVYRWHCDLRATAVVATSRREYEPMPSPFPGMDPYLEDDKLWSAFQHQLVGCLYQILLPSLVDRYRARVSQRH